MSENDVYASGMRRRIRTSANAVFSRVFAKLINADDIEINNSLTKDGNSYLLDAPADNSKYARKNNAWVAVSDGGGGGGSTDWDDITNKPESYPPSEHAHSTSDITDFPTNVSTFTNDAGYLTKHQSLDDYVKTDDSRLTDARTPLAHTHETSEINSFEGDVASIASKTKIATISTADSSATISDDGLYIDADSYGEGYAALRSELPTKTSELTNDSGFLTEHQDISGKQDVLVSGTNIKTINNKSLLGSGNITIEGGSGGSTDWEDITNKPDTFTPSVHTHTISEITDAVDYIVEQGTSGNWTYRKWNSGLIEMMGYVTVSLGSTWTSVGGHYRYVTSVTMPFSIPYTNRIECFGAGSVSGCIVLAHNGDTLIADNKVEVIAYKEASGTATYSCKMNIKVSGYES